MNRLSTRAWRGYKGLVQLCPLWTVFQPETDMIEWYSSVPTWTVFQQEPSVAINDWYSSVSTWTVFQP